MDIRKSSKKLCAKVIAFALTAIILAQSGMTAYAAQDISGNGLTMMASEGADSDSASPAAQKDADAREKSTEAEAAESSDQGKDAAGQSGSEDADASDPTGEDIDSGEQEPSDEPGADSAEQDQQTGNPDASESAGESGDTGNMDGTDSGVENADDPENSSGLDDADDSDGANSEAEGSEWTELPGEDAVIGENAEDFFGDSESDRSLVCVKLIEQESSLHREEPVAQLTAEQIAVLDEALAQAAERITPEITVEDEKILFSGKLGYVDGYYLAFRINPDMERFTEDGTIRISYLDGNGEEICCDSPERVWQDGFWDVIMPYPADCREMTITVDNDGENDGDDGEAESEASDNADSRESEGQDAAPTVGDIDSEMGEAVDRIEERIVYLSATYYVDLSGVQTIEPEEVPAVELMAEDMPENDVTLIDMTAPVIKKITTRDTTAELTFVPNDVVRSVKGETDQKGGRGYYTLTLQDKATGKEVETVNTADISEGTEVKAACTYTLSIGEDSTEASPLYMCRIQGLSSNKTYTAILVAHYDYGMEDVDPLTKSSKSMNFTTKKVMLTTEGSLPVSYVSMAELRIDPNAAGSRIEYGENQEISLSCGEPYALFAEVSNLSRALETEKLKWTIQILNDDGTKKTADAKSATLKAGVSTYEVQLELMVPGSYIVTAVSTVTKEVLSEFVIAATRRAGSDTARLSLQSELFYFYQGSKGKLDKTMA